METLYNQMDINNDIINNQVSISKQLTLWKKFLKKL